MEGSQGVPVFGLKLYSLPSEVQTVKADSVLWVSLALLLRLRITAGG